MRRRFGLVVAALAVLTTVAIGVIAVVRPPAQLAALMAGHTGPVRTLRWPELLAPGWDPFEELRRLRRETPAASDADPRATILYERIREVFDSAPTNPQLDGQVVRMTGYVVPLDQGAKGLKSFLLVPSFGACIHTPAPPSNQIVHVTLRRPTTKFRTMDVVWVNGKLKLERTESARGKSAYSLDSFAIERYDDPPR